MCENGKEVRNENLNSNILSVGPMESPAAREVLNVDDYDDDSFFYTPHLGKTSATPISIERYNDLRDLNLAIMASLKPSQHSNSIDLSHSSYSSDDELKILDYTPHLFPSKKPRIFSPEKGQSSNSNSNPQIVCEICVEPMSSDESFLIKGCKHSYCKHCITRYVASKLEENITNIRCPVSNCEGLLGLEYCRAILPQQVFDRWGDALCEAVILGSEKLYCPYKDCSAMMINDGDKSIKESECSSCWRLFCAQCKVPWHSDISCEEFQKLHKDEREREDIMLMKLAENKLWRRCPNCRVYVERTWGCRYMRCSHRYSSSGYSRVTPLKFDPREEHTQTNLIGVEFSAQPTPRVGYVYTFVKSGMMEKLGYQLCFIMLCPVFQLK